MFAVHQSSPVRTKFLLYTFGELSLHVWKLLGRSRLRIVTFWCPRESHQKHAKHALIVAWSHLRARGKEERALMSNKYLQFSWTSNWIKQIVNSSWKWIIEIFSLLAAAFSNSRERGNGLSNVILFMWSWRLTIRYWDRLMSLFTKTHRCFMQRCRDFSNDEVTDCLLHRLTAIAGNYWNTQVV